MREEDGPKDLKWDQIIMGPTSTLHWYEDIGLKQRQ